MKKNKSKKKRLKSATLFVLLAILNITWYTIAVLVLTANDHSVPDSLTAAFFAAWTSELWILWKIKDKNQNMEEKGLTKDEQPSEDDDFPEAQTEEDVVVDVMSEEDMVNEPDEEDVENGEV